jgi:hypothetical protein
VQGVGGNSCSFQPEAVSLVMNLKQWGLGLKYFSYVCTLPPDFCRKCRKSSCKNEHIVTKNKLTQIFEMLLLIFVSTYLYTVYILFICRVEVQTGPLLYSPSYKCQLQYCTV